MATTQNGSVSLAECRKISDEAYYPGNIHHCLGSRTQISLSKFADDTKVGGKTLMMAD